MELLVFCFNNKVYNTHKQATRLGPSYNILVESHKQKYIRNLKINLRQTLDMSPRWHSREYFFIEAECVHEFRQNGIFIILTYQLL